ncbi:hypothetical protein C8J57DRAFT_1712682 [Mycena rebaudengoi]|nr:hypothetical protein C8J57DRAFT_1712682 [Mycena rebaudengoi]
MQFSAFLFNPIIRVYTLRALLLVALAVIALELGTLVNFRQKWLWALQWALPSMGLGCLIVVHHISALFANQKLIAVVDLFLNISEIICAIVLIVLNETLVVFDSNIPHSYVPSITRPVLATEIRVSWLLPPCKSPIYAMEDSTQSLVGETTSQPRGEFIGIIILRALILSGIVLGIPAFAVYSIIYIPLRAHIRLDTFIGRFGGPWEIDSSASDRDVIIAIRPLSDVTEWVYPAYNTLVYGGPQRSEGGRPGDASAGIVAFIRERLVDLDPVEGQDVFTKDLEAQGDARHSEIQANCAPHSPPGRSLEGDFLLNSARNESSSILSGTSLSRGYLIQAGYRLDDIPLAD